MRGSSSGSGCWRAGAPPEAVLAHGDCSAVAINLHGNPLPRRRRQQLLAVPRRGRRRRRGPQARRYDCCCGCHDACRDAGAAACEGAARVAARRWRRRVVAPAGPAEGVAAAAGGWRRRRRRTGQQQPACRCGCSHAGALPGRCWGRQGAIWASKPFPPSPKPAHSAAACTGTTRELADRCLRSRGGEGTRALLPHTPATTLGPSSPRIGTSEGRFLWDMAGMRGEGGGPRVAVTPALAPPGLQSHWPLAAGGPFSWPARFTVACSDAQGLPLKHTDIIKS